MPESLEVNNEILLLAAPKKVSIGLIGDPLPDAKVVEEFLEDVNKRQYGREIPGRIFLRRGPDFENES